MVRVIIVLVVAMTMVLLARIGARFGVERGFYGTRGPAQPAHHIGDDVVGSNAHDIAQKLYGQMPVAQMPNDTHQQRRIACGNFHQRLRPSADANDAAILQQQAIVLTQPHGLRQIQQHVAPRLRP